jgi:mannose-1-phosphate guanylyltransferase/phosphomannomutase
MDASGWITEFIEKPERGSNYGNLANSGIYVVEPDLLRWIPPARPFDFGSDLFPKLIEEGMPLLGDDTPAYTLDIGSVERYRQAQVDVQSGLYRSSLPVNVVV